MTRSCAGGGRCRTHAAMDHQKQRQWPTAGQPRHPSEGGRGRRRRRGGRMPRRRRPRTEACSRSQHMRSCAWKAGRHLSAAPVRHSKMAMNPLHSVRKLAFSKNNACPVQYGATAAGESTSPCKKSGEPVLKLCASGGAKRCTCARRGQDRRCRVSARESTLLRTIEADLAKMPVYSAKRWKTCRRENKRSHRASKIQDFRDFGM